MARPEPTKHRQPRIGELRTAGSFLRGLKPFLGRPRSLADGRACLERQLDRRETTFLDVLRRGVFGHAASPYRRLLERAGISLGDVEATLAAEGLDRTLERLYDAGVYVTLEEFKGRRPLERPGLDLPVRAEDFDNPLASPLYEARTGGSTGDARRILVDLGLLEHESAYHALFYAAAQASAGPVAIWHPAPPGAVGIKFALIHAKLGRPAERWFSQSRLRDSSLKHALFTTSAVVASRLCGARIPAPEHTAADGAGRVASWLARKRAIGAPATLVTTASAGVRTCMAAIDRGLDIAGTLLVLGGEPFTAAKAAVVARVGALGACHYAMVEAGAIGIACRAAEAPDDVHLLSDKMATIQRDRPVGTNGGTVGALFHTTLLAASPKVMLNVESGDYGVREERDCGCGAVPAAFRSHLHTIRSYEKLTSEGMSFLGSDLLDLVEHVLPNRFGGHPTDYQLAEREEDGLPRVSLVVSSAVGAIDQRLVVEAVLDFLRHRGLAESLMAEVWAQSGTLEVLRGEPRRTPGGKILPLTVRAG